LSRLEAGHVQPSLGTLEKLLMALEADLALLAVAHSAVEGAPTGAFRPPLDLPLDEQQALMLAAASFHHFLRAASSRLCRPETVPNDPF
jgi:hypothetical protein